MGLELRAFPKLRMLQNGPGSIPEAHLRVQRHTPWGRGPSTSFLASLSLGEWSESGTCGESAGGPFQVGELEFVLLLLAKDSEEFAELAPIKEGRHKKRCFFFTSSGSPPIKRSSAPNPGSFPELSKLWSSLRTHTRGVILKRKPPTRAALRPCSRERSSKLSCKTVTTHCKLRVGLTCVSFVKLSPLSLQACHRCCCKTNIRRGSLSSCLYLLLLCSTVALSHPPFNYQPAHPGPSPPPPDFWHIPEETLAFGDFRAETSPA